jgi:hypothetical protein
VSMRDACASGQVAVIFPPLPYTSAEEIDAHVHYADRRHHVPVHVGDRLRRRS